MTIVRCEAEGPVLTVEAQYVATAEELWQLFEDKSLLEQWWGPPSWPATFSRLEFTSKGEARYHMTGPDGSESHGWWQIEKVEFPELIFVDGFSDADGVPDTSLPTNRTIVRVSDDGKTGTLVIISEYENEEALQTVLDMGMEEGMTLALNQIDLILLPEA